MADDDLDLFELDEKTGQDNDENSTKGKSISLLSRIPHCRVCTKTGF